MVGYRLPKRSGSVEWSSLQTAAFNAGQRMVLLTKVGIAYMLRLYFNAHWLRCSWWAEDRRSIAAGAIV